MANATAKLPARVDQVLLCELGWVLQRSFAYSRTDVHDAIAALLEYDVLSAESAALVRKALQWLTDGPADFSDCLLAARAKRGMRVLTLDRKAAKTDTHRLLT